MCSSDLYGWINLIPNSNLQSGIGSNGISHIGSLIGIVLGGILFDLIGFSSTLALFCLFSLFSVPFAVKSSLQTNRSICVAQSTNQPSSRNFALHCCGFCIGNVGPGLIMSTLGFILLSRYGTEVNLMGFEDRQSYWFPSIHLYRQIKENEIGRASCRERV